MDKVDFQRRLLDWYDQNARRLPWRAPPGSAKAMDPYRVWLSEIMLQQTTVATVIPYFQTFTARWPRVEDLARAEDDDVMAAWAGLGYYARARNMLKAARVVADERAGKFPENERDLRALPGIGPYTAAAIAAIAFDQPSNVVDGNIERVMARLFAETSPLPQAKKALTDHAATLVPKSRPGDHAQALMDLGARICVPKTPKCDLCPVCKFCQGFAKGIAAGLPAKSPKPLKPTRYADVFVAITPDDQVLTERRPPKGLLGGMLALPLSPMTDAPADKTEPPFPARWQDTGRTAHHSFTHFHIVLNIKAAKLANPDLQSLHPWQKLELQNRSALPTLFRKVLDAYERPLRTGQDTR